MKKIGVVMLSCLMCASAHSRQASEQYVDVKIALATNAVTSRLGGEISAATNGLETAAHAASTYQPTIGDLDTIRSGAAAGFTAVQPAAISDMETRTHAAATYQPQGNYLIAESDPTVDGKINTHNSSTSAHSDIRTALAGKQAVISDLATIRSGAAAGATAVQPSDLVATSALTNDNGVALVNLKDYTYRYEDLSTWHQTDMIHYGWQSIAYASGIYVAGDWREDGLWYSTNGIAWQQGLTVGGWFVAHGNGRFVAARNGFRVGYSDSGIRYSDDGINWTQSIRSPSSWTCLAYGGGKFVACAEHYSQPGYNGIWYSSDGITWTCSEQVEGVWGCIAYGGGKFVAGIHDVYSQSHLNGLWYSFDGVNWKQSGKTDGSWQCITYGNGKFVAGGAGSGIWYSANGIDWTQSEKTDGAWSCMTYGNGRFVASSSDSSSFGIWYSDDGITWTQSGETNRSWNCMTYADGRFVAGAGSDGGRGIWYTDTASETVVPIVQQLQVDGQPIAPDSHNVVNIETKESKKRYAMFILTMNELRNECSGNWSQFELKASTNNFTTTAIPGEDWRETVKRKMIFMSHSAYADMPGAFETDGMRMYINTRGATATEKEQWKYHRIRNTSTDPLIRGSWTYTPTDIIVIVDPAMLYLHADAEWLRPDNDDLTWTFLKADETDYERDPEDGERGLWRPTAPVRWLETLPDWAL